MTPNSVTPPIAVKWKLRLQVDERSARSFNPPVVLDETIYFGSTDGNFYALDIESGYMRWVFKTERPINSVPFADEDNVYFGSNDGKVYAVSRDEGNEIWSFFTGNTVQSTVTRYEDWIVFTSDVGATYFLDLNGVEEFQIPNPVWLYHTFQLYRDVMYFAPGPPTAPYSFGAYDIDQRAYLFVVDAANDDARWYSFPALRDRVLYYSTCGDFRDHWVFTYYALDRERGDIIWRYIDESNFRGVRPGSLSDLFEDNLELLDYMAPSLWKDLVIYTSGDNVVRAFDSKTGRLVWKRAFDYPTSSAPTVAGGRVYFGVSGEDVAAETGLNAASPKLVCLAGRDGRVLWEMGIEGKVLSAPVVAGKWLVFGTSRNFFYVLEEVY